MKICKPSREAEVCDTCHCEGYLQECLVCGGQFCLTHRAIIAGCWVSPDVCKACGSRADVQAVVEKAAAQIGPIIRARSAALVALPAEYPAEEGDSDGQD